MVVCGEPNAKRTQRNAAGDANKAICQRDSQMIIAHKQVYFGGEGAVSRQRAHEACAKR